MEAENHIRLNATQRYRFKRIKQFIAADRFEPDPTSGI